MIPTKFGNFMEMKWKKLGFKKKINKIWEIF